VVKKEADMMLSACAAIIVAGGAGSRAGGQTPKQYRWLGGKPVLRWSVEAMLRCKNIARIVVVVPADDSAAAAALLPADSRIRFAIGGATRTDSVRAGLAALSDPPPDRVLIHDAARPGLTPETIDQLIAALDDADASAPVLPMTDAVKSLADGIQTVPRDDLVRVQTPQAFRHALLRAAYDETTDAAVDDLELVQRSRAAQASGMRFKPVPGHPRLMKITHAEDFTVVEKLIAAPAMRIGTGFDVHGFEPGDAVILCGVRIPHAKKLEGHSDADAGWHALTDAILGAAALGDIGDHFPPSDPKWKGANSLVFLKHAVKLAADRGLKVVNADITLLCEKPKIAPHREAMRVATAEALGVDVGCVSVKATTTEKLGFLGREEGIAAQASVLLAG
jgi:2-C-methyl-D-erythritol 4-phosphate cytidylyltransferase/2-C-methyl-D-erythritol 2,4-cyclodiphosphate synthase